MLTKEAFARHEDYIRKTVDDYLQSATNFDARQELKDKYWRIGRHVVAKNETIDWDNFHKEDFAKHKV